MCRSEVPQAHRPGAIHHQVAVRSRGALTGTVRCHEWKDRSHSDEHSPVLISISPSATCPGVAPAGLLARRPAAVHAAEHGR